MLGKSLTSHGHGTAITRVDAGYSFFRAEKTMLILFTKVEGSSALQVAGNEDARCGDVYRNLAVLGMTLFAVWMKTRAGSPILALEVTIQYMYLLPTR